MKKIIAYTNDIVWGAPALVLILGVGLYLTVRLKAVQVTAFPEAFRLFCRQLRPGKGSSSYQALCTALAATVGTGNLVGVAGAICLGGPGAVFWMWVCGILGMATKYTEAALAVRYREKTRDGYAGGPMYIIRKALPEKLHVLAWVYAAFGLFAAFGVGNATQINAMLTALRPVTGERGKLVLGIGIAVLVGVMLSGGAKRIARELLPLVQRWDKVDSAALAKFAE